LRFEVQKDFEDLLVTHLNIGVRWSDHKKSKANEGYFLTAQTYPLDVIPESARAARPM
jgi:iron complex outermembrane receptor protein